MAKAGDQPIVGSGGSSGSSGPASPGPLTFEMGNAPGAGALGGVTETSPFAGFIFVLTDETVDNSSPYNVATLNYANPREDNEYIPVQCTPLDQATAELTWWVQERDEQFTIRATNLQPSTSYNWAFSLY